MLLSFTLYFRSNIIYKIPLGWNSGVVVRPNSNSG